MSERECDSPCRKPGQSGSRGRPGPVQVTDRDTGARGWVTHEVGVSRPVDTRVLVSVSPGSRRDTPVDRSRSGGRARNDRRGL